MINFVRKDVTDISQVQIEIFDSFGKEVWKGTGTTEISTMGWNSGVYYVKAVHQSKNYMGQLVIQ